MHQCCRCVIALAWSPDGNYLTIVTGDNAHSVYVYELNLHTASSPKRVFSGQGHRGEPPQVFGALWNPYKRGIDPRTSESVPAPLQFITYGVKHLKFWNYDTKVDTYHGCTLLHRVESDIPYQ
jgi:microtubule-associated protein-like 6